MNDLTLRSEAALLALRPAVEADYDDAPTVGNFLHRTLRPVLKLQNDLLLQAVADFVADHHLPVATLAPTELQRQLTTLLTRNIKLRYTLIGLVTGLFTPAEYAFYCPHRAEINRRLLELTQRRVLDQAAAIGAAVVGAA